MIDIASIVPSARDFLQSIATKRKRLVLIPLVDRVDDAHALADAGVGAFAVSSPGEAMRAISAAVGSTPVLSLSAVGSTNDALLAHSRGADAVVVAETDDVSSWTGAAKTISSMRMAPLAAIVDDASAAFVATTSAKGGYLKAESVASIRNLAARLASLRTVAHLPSADEIALRALRGVVDAVIVDSALYLSTSFATLREELDP